MSDLVARIVFTGICMFVHPEEGAKPPEAALFMDGRDSDHHVYLAVNADVYTLTQLPPKFNVEHLIGDSGVNYDVIQLDEKLIAVASLLKEVTVEVDDFQYVPSLGKAWPRMFFGTHKGAAELHEQLINTLKNRVLARFSLTGGRLKNTYVSGYEWQFRPKVMTRHQLQQRIAQEVSLATTLTDDALELSVRDRMTGVPETVLKIKPNISNIDVIVLLANVPKADLFPKAVCGEQNSCEAHPECCADPHFHHYYNAFDDPPSDPPVPHRLSTISINPVQPELQLFRVGGANCGPTQYP